MAQWLGRSPSTISRELRRNVDDQGSHPPDMQLLATETVIRQAEMMADELTG